MAEAMKAPRLGAVPLVALMAIGLALAACTSEDGNGDGDGATVTTPAVTDETIATTVTSIADTTSTPTTAELTTTTPQSTTTTSASMPDTKQDLFLAPTGLTIIDTESGDSTLVAFGDDRTATVDLVDQALGTAGIIGDGFAECPNGQESVAEWPDLVLDFNLDEELISWRLPRGSTLTDTDGLGLGSPRSELSDELQATIEESTIGIEFGTRDTIFGILSGPGDDAVIESLFSVDTCAFR